MQLPSYTRPYATLLLFFAVACAGLDLARPADAMQEATIVKVKKRAAKRHSRPTSFWPAGVEWDTSIATPKSHFGFDIGFRHLEHGQVVSYLRAVANASDRVTLEQYGTTHGGRPLILLTITSQKNRKRIGEIQKRSRRLAEANNEKIVTDDLPVVINMGYGVHGDEPSATNCAPLVAYYLAAARGDQIDNWLNDCVVLLDPCLNPDGFNRFATWVNRYRGVVPNPDPQHAEHHQQWPPGRVNYYWFDLNRDWLPLVHPESQSRMRWYHKWKPNVVLDYHEMGTNSTYFFQPGIPQRKNPLTPIENVELTNKFAKYHASALDGRGSLYFTQESFDDFYMGKGSTYPDLHGAVGILFEQASARGHVQQNQDGLLKFHDTIANHFATSLSSLKASVELRGELHEYKRKFYADALAMGRAAKRQTYVFTCPHNRTRLQAFASVLLHHDIQCFWLKEPLEYGDATFDPRWTLVVPAQQAEYRFLKSLLMRRTNFRENVFYDVSSWTLPLAFGLKQITIKKEIDKQILVAAKNVAKWESAVEFADDDVAYLVDWRDDGAQRLLAQLLKRGINVRVARKPFGYANHDSAKKFGYGTLQIPLGVQKNKRKSIQNILRRAAKNGVDITAVKTGLTTDGIDLGSNNFPVVVAPKLAMLTGPGVSAYGAGEIWHLLDTRIGMPVTMIKQSSLAGADLHDYTTMILPDGDYDRLSETEWTVLQDFAKKGGTIISIGRSTGEVAAKLTGSDNVVMAEDADDEMGDASGEELVGTIQQPYGSAARKRALELISGAIFNTSVDRTHPLGYGIQAKHVAVFRNHTTFVKPSDDPYSNPLVYDGKKPLLAGYCSDENVERFKGAASVVVYPLEKGRVILMSDNPNFRGFWRGTSRLFMNALFFGDLAGQ